MHRKRFAVVTLAVAAGAAALFLPRAAHGAPTAPTANARIFGVSIVDLGGTCTSRFCYAPANLTIHQVDSVTWTNNSSSIHTVTTCTTSACSGTGPGTGTDPAFNSGVINQAASFTLQFHGVGTYNYYCQIHGFTVMHGIITVKAFAVTTRSLPAGTVGTAYSARLKAAGGQTPLTWSLVSGTLPAGLHLSSGGLISGTPTTAGTSNFTVQVTDSSSPTKLTAQKALSITVS
jgi:plastocyanin